MIVYIGKGRTSRSCTGAAHEITSLLSSDMMMLCIFLDMALLIYRSRSERADCSTYKEIRVITHL